MVTHSDPLRLRLHELIDTLNEGQLPKAAQALEIIHRHSEPQAGSQRGAELPHTSMIQQNGLLVHLGKAPQGLDWEHLMDEEREDRIREIGSL